MAMKSDFTEQQWESLQKGVLGAGLLVSLSDRSFFDTFKEAGALAKHVAAAKQSNTSELVRELADVHGTGFGLTSSPDKDGKDAATFARLDDETGVSATTDVDAALAGCDAVAYMASGDIRPD